MAEEVKQEVKEQPKKKSLTEWVDEHPNAVFWARFVAWAMFACVLPFSFIVWRFQLFRTIAKVQIGGWGLIAIIIVAVFVFSVLKYIRIGLNAKHTMVGQILGGICKVVIPLLAALFILWSVRDNVNLMIQVLGCVVICETIAIPLNPLPKWAYEQQKDVRDEERKEAADYIIEKFFKKKKEVDGGGE